MGGTESAEQRGFITVLLVEDNAQVRAFAGMILRDSGYVVIEAADGAQALESIRGVGKVDVLVSDIVMPGMRGTELARRFQLARPGVPVVMMSGYAPEPIPGELSAVTLLSKPFSAGQLVAAVGRALSSAPQGFDSDTSALDAGNRKQGRARHAVPI